MRPVPPGTGPKARLLIAMGLIKWVVQRPAAPGWWEGSDFSTLETYRGGWRLWQGWGSKAQRHTEAEGLDALAEL